MVLLATAVAVALGAGELFLGRFNPVAYRVPAQERPEDVWRGLLHRKSAVPGLDYELVPNASGFAEGAPIATNSHGMRDRERSVRKPGGVVRIAALGDSYTFGHGVSAEESYPAVLERLLNEQGGPVRYEVLNFGVSGYSTREEALVLRHKALPWEPDLVLVGYVLNDPEIDPWQPLHAYFHDAEWWQHSHLLRLIARAGRSAEVRRYGGGDYTRYQYAHPATWGSVVGAFDDIKDAAGAAGSGVVVAIFPRVPRESWSRYAYRDLHDQVALAARERGFAVVDLYDSMRPLPPRELRLRAGDPHPNRLGHEVAARAIFEALRSGGFLGQPAEAGSR